MVKPLCSLIALFALLSCGPNELFAQSSKNMQTNESRPQISFVNESQSEMEVLWLSNDDDESVKQMGRVEANGSLELQTTLGHKFQIRLLDRNLNLTFSAIQPNQRIVVKEATSEFDLHGWSISLNHQLWVKVPQQTQTMLKLMSVQLKRIIDVMPAKPLKRIQQVKVWINPQYDGVQPTAEYHPGKDWLKENDRAVEMVKSIEVTNVKNFEFENTRMPYVMLHELAHAYHDQVLGFKDVRIREAFERATDSGVYDDVRRFTGRKYIQDKAYALSNHKEYFAESTEAYFGKNDFFPFDRQELKQADAEMEKLLLEIWGEPRK